MSIVCFTNTYIYISLIISNGKGMGILNGEHKYWYFYGMTLLHAYIDSSIVFTGFPPFFRYNRNTRHGSVECRNSLGNQNPSNIVTSYFNPTLAAYTV